MANSFKKNIWCVIPVFNNTKNIKNFACECLLYLDNVLIIDDRSSDLNLTKLFDGTKITVITLSETKGKRKAILTALDFLQNKNADYIIWLDSYRQYLPKNILNFIPKILETDNSIIIGCRNFSSENLLQKNNFKRKFSNLLFKIETGLDLKDSLSNFRAYPIKYLKQLKLTGDFLDFDIEVLTRAAWAGLNFIEIDTDGFYPEKNNKISRLRRFVDILKFALMHLRLIGRHLLPWSHKKIIKNNEKTFDKKLFKKPIKLIKFLVSENNSPLGLAAAAFVGTILAVLPFIGLHSVLIIYFSAKLNLNKIMALAIQNLYIPPFVPFVCIEVGYFMRTGHWLTDLSLNAFKSYAPTFMFDWLLGSLILAPVYAIIAAVVVYFISSKIQKKKITKNE